MAAWKLLESNTGHAVRMTDIAKATGVSRQAVYLHFLTRADLLIATTRHVDEVNNVDARLAESRSATSGAARLTAFIDAWGNYIPVIYPVAKALRAMQEADEDAGIAWSNRMAAVREGCQAAVSALKKEGALSSDLSVGQATDILWMLLSVENWELLTKTRGWSQSRYIETIKYLAERTLLATVTGSQ